MAIINLSHRGDTSFDKLLGHLPSVQENGMHWKIY